MNAILSMALKDLRLLFRDKFALFWIFAFPLMFALFFGAVFGTDDQGGRGALLITVVDEDASQRSTALIERLSESESVRIARTGTEESAPREALDVAAARQAVQKGRRAAYLRIPSGYGDSPFAMFGGGDDSASPLEIGIDPGRRAEAGFLQGALMEASFRVMTDRFTDSAALSKDLGSARERIDADTELAAPKKIVLKTFLGALEMFANQFDLGSGVGGGGEAADAPGAIAAKVVDVTRDESRRPRSAFDITLPQALVWGLMSVAMTFAITLVRERSSGTLLRLRISPVSHTQLLIGKGLGCFLACNLTMAALTTFAAVALGVRFDSLPLLFLAMICIAACFTGLMMTVSNLGRTEAAVAGSSWGLMMPFAMVGGGMIPLIAMPSWLVTASKFSFFRWAITSVEGAIWRGFTFGDMLLPCAVLLGIGTVFFTVGVVLFHRSVE